MRRYDDFDIGLRVILNRSVAPHLWQNDTIYLRSTLIHAYRTFESAESISGFSALNPFE